eukprot:TRINITY_DN5112_c0_g1_i1.p1 TRINITY_DN5112_c0_g1~~TRINITY_DN5112_c0_g1_i1.p1  ORF type:complete len:545 (+),score=126.75 TRINITY_DN5112_c0_g1_i1:56-1690(+)
MSEVAATDQSESSVTRSETEQLIHLCDTTIADLESALERLHRASHAASQTLSAAIGDASLPPQFPSDGVALLHWVDERFHALFSQLRSQVDLFRTLLAQQILTTQALMRNAHDRVHARLTQLRADADALKALPSVLIRAQISHKPSSGSPSTGSPATLSRIDRSRIRRLSLRARRTLTRATTTLRRLPPIPSPTEISPSSTSTSTTKQTPANTEKSTDEAENTDQNTETTAAPVLRELPWLPLAREAAQQNTQLLQRLLDEWVPFPSCNSSPLPSPTGSGEQMSATRNSLWDLSGLSDDEQDGDGDLTTDADGDSEARLDAASVDRLLLEEEEDLQRSRSLFQVDWQLHEWTWDASRIGTGVVLSPDSCRAENTSWFGTGHVYGSIGLSSGRHAFDIKILALGTYLAVGLAPANRRSGAGNQSASPSSSSSRDSYLSAYSWLSDGIQYDAHAGLQSHPDAAFAIGDVVTIEFLLHPTKGWVAIHNASSRQSVRQRIHPIAEDADPQSAFYFPYIELGSGAAAVLLCRRTAHPMDEAALLPPDDF